MSSLKNEIVITIIGISLIKCIQMSASKPGIGPVALKIALIQGWCHLGGAEGNFPLKVSKKVFFFF